MSILDFNWGWFVLVCSLIGITRLLFLQFLPFRLLSATTAATLGFVLFLSFPILGYSNLLAIPVGDYSGLVLLAYVCFLTGAASAARLLGSNRTIEDAPAPDGQLTRFALAACILWVASLLVQFFWLGGFSHMLDVFLGGWAHLQVVAQIEDSASNNQGLSFLEIANLILGNMFMCFWVIVFLRKPKWALIIWGVYILTSLDQYISRSALLGLVLVPVLAHVMLHHPSRQRVAWLATVILVAGLIFLSWDAAVRLGATYEISPQQVMSDTVRDAGNSAVPATIILSDNIRGNSGTYFLAIATFLVPRSIWRDKPNEQYNYAMTYQLTGLVVGHGTSVITSTMLGEAWYYFGWSGTVWLMLMFGFSAYAFENVLTRNLYSVGPFLNIFYITIIYIRSTFLVYFQAGVMAILTVAMVIAIVKMLSLKRTAAGLVSPQPRLEYPG